MGVGVEAREAGVAAVGAVLVVVVGFAGAGEGAGAGAGAGVAPPAADPMGASTRCAMADLGIAIRPASGERITTWVESSDKKSPETRSPFERVRTSGAAASHAVETPPSHSLIHALKILEKRCPGTNPDPHDGETHRE